MRLRFLFDGPRLFSAQMPRVDWLLAIILLAALAIRLYSVAFGLPALTDPDELMFELGAYRMIDGGQLNPEWFGHHVHARAD
jgi:hypothetical protein